MDAFLDRVYQLYKTHLKRKGLTVVRIEKLCIYIQIPCNVFITLHI